MRRFTPQLLGLSSGDLLRTAIRNKTALGVAASEMMNSGGLLDDQLMMELIREEFQSRGWALQPEIAPDLLKRPLSSPIVPTSTSRQQPNLPTSQTRSFFTSCFNAATSSLSASSSATSHVNSSWILDGFPRTLAQATLLDDYLVPQKQDLNFVINLTVPKDAILDRIRGRWIHATSGRTYNTTYNRPKVEGLDDVTGEPLEKRVDDEEGVYVHRLETYAKMTVPLTQYYTSQGILWSVSGSTSDEIWPQIEQEIIRRFQDV